jgi:hypothetical protein
MMSLEPARLEENLLTNMTQKLTESKLKLLKMLKDMIIKLLRRVNWNIDKRKKIQTVGIVHSGDY